MLVPATSGGDSFVAKSLATNPAISTLYFYGCGKFRILKGMLIAQTGTLATLKAEDRPGSNCNFYEIGLEGDQSHSAFGSIIISVGSNGTISTTYNAFRCPMCLIWMVP